MKSWLTKNGYKVIRLLGGRSNVFFVTNGSVNILIDTSPQYRWKKLKKRLLDQDIDHIDYLILTHAHFDHAANALKIREKFNSQVVIHRCEANYLGDGHNARIKGTNALTRMIVNALTLKLLYWLKYHPCKYDILVDSSFDFKTKGVNIQVIHTPGHTIGSISIIVDDEIAIVGDTMFGIFWNSVFPPFAENVKELLNSWGKLLNTQCHVFIPSHGSANSRKLVEKCYNQKLKK